jgi:hypothetical protein
MKIVFTNIDFETDGEDVELPSEMSATPEEMGYDADADGELEEFVDMQGADYISDVTGWLVNGFSFKIEE